MPATTMPSSTALPTFAVPARPDIGLAPIIRDRQPVRDLVPQVYRFAEGRSVKLLWAKSSLTYDSLRDALGRLLGGALQLD
jgi:hypothetical protein